MYDLDGKTYPLHDPHGTLAGLDWEGVFRFLWRPTFTVEGPLLDGRVLSAEPHDGNGFRVFADHGSWLRLGTVGAPEQSPDHGWLDIARWAHEGAAWSVTAYDGEDGGGIQDPALEATVATHLWMAVWNAHGEGANDFATRTEVQLSQGSFVVHGDPDASNGSRTITRQRALDMLARTPAPCPAGVTPAQALTLLGRELLALDERGEALLDALLPARMRALWNVAMVERTRTQDWPTGAEAAVGLGATPADARFYQAVLGWDGAPCLIEEAEVLRDDGARVVRVVTAAMDDMDVVAEVAPLAARWRSPDPYARASVDAAIRRMLWDRWFHDVVAGLHSLDAVGDSASEMPEQLYALAGMVGRETGKRLADATTEELRRVVFGPWAETGAEQALPLAPIGALSMVLREGDRAIGGTSDRADAVLSWMEPLLRQVRNGGREPTRPAGDPPSGASVADRRKQERAARKKKRKQRRK